MGFPNREFPGIINMEVNSLEFKQFGRELPLHRSCRAAEDTRNNIYIQDITSLID